MTKPRGRPKKKRIVQQAPRISQFSPRGRPGRPDERDLALDELESLRLADMLNLSQKEAAKLMKISQQTFSRILKGARKAVADCLVSGKIIHIQGKPYVVNSAENFPKKPAEDKEIPPKQSAKRE